MKKPSLRLDSHPILPIPERKTIHFFFNGKKIEAAEGEMISSALFASDIKIFGHHHLDGSPQGIFCANGQCAQCTVIADDLPVKSCMVPVKEGMKIKPLNGLPELPDVPAKVRHYKEIPHTKCDVLIIGAGPSGISAAIELGKLKKDVIIVDDKGIPGGKLVLQTHTFFGSISDCHAGTRGIDIATILSKELEKFPSVKIWLNSTAIAVFKDKKVGILKDGRYSIVEPSILLNAAGAREKALAFPGCDLPGVYGAGAFQTLLNRDLIKTSERLFIIGGGNVGIIAGYHALQAGIKVIGLVEALPVIGGYLVHANKLKRFGISLYTSHTVVECSGGENGVESITICGIDKNFKKIEGTNKTFSIDTVLVAVGLNPIDELGKQAKSFGMKVFSAGDADEIAEASAAMFSGKIKGLEIAATLGEKASIPGEWHSMNDILKQKPGKIYPVEYSINGHSVFPVFHCFQEIPCNPCTEVCPNKSINIPDGGLMGVPVFNGKCSGCMKCVAICPGLSITLVDKRKTGEDFAIVTIPFELHSSWVTEGKEINVVDVNGNILSKSKIIKVSDKKFQDRTLLVSFQMPSGMAQKAVGIRLFEEEKPSPDKGGKTLQKTDNVIVCRCERVNSERIRNEIKNKTRDFNELKANLRCGMGSCGGKTCTQIIERIFREEHVKPEETTSFTHRPIEMEVPIEVFAGVEK